MIFVKAIQDYIEKKDLAIDYFVRPEGIYIDADNDEVDVITEVLKMQSYFNDVQPFSVGFSYNCPPLMDETPYFVLIG